MSYILDALKQNGAVSHSNRLMQTDYQQEYLLNKKLSFYRNLALVLGFLLTLSLGFLIGKSIQSDTPLADTPVVHNALGSAAQSVNNTHDNANNNASNTLPAQPVMANHSTNIQANLPANNVQYQFVPVPVYTTCVA